MTRVFRLPVSWFAILLAAPFGCADPADSPDEGIVTAAIETYVPHQGRLLLGFENPDVRVFSFPTLPGTRVGQSGELISGAIGGLAYAGVAVAATGADATPIEMRIAQVIAPEAPGLPWQYVLEQLDPSSGAWGPACANPPQLVPNDQPALPVPAIAMSGIWLPDGLYFVSASSVTFACHTGVVAKCVKWGYGPTTTPPHVTEHGMTTFATGADMMQACTRMARADYCTGGLPNTLDGTPIHIDDVFTTVPAVPGFTFEAAWAGRAVVDRRFLRPPVVCLSKARWSTIPLNGSCPLLLPDPRVDDKGKFCDDIPETTLEAKGALLYSSSAYVDAGLYTYTDPASQLRLTTASLLPEAVGRPAAWIIAPPSGVNFPIVGGPQPRFEATIFAAALPVQIPDTNLAKLFSYRCEADLITSTVVPQDPSCAQIALEGHVYPPNTPGRAPLRRWYHPDFKHSNTTTVSPSTMIADKWELQEVVGGVLRAAIDVNVRWSSLVGYSYALDVQTRSGEWIPSCVDAAHLGTATSFVYRGICVGAANRAIHHTDILTFRVTYTNVANPTQIFTAARLYDGVASDAYVALDNGKTTAITVTWNDLGLDKTYAFDVRRLNGDWIRCADPDQLANDTSYVHTTLCPSAGVNVKISSIIELRVCSTDRKAGKDLSCSEVKYDGRAPVVQFLLKP